jgi:hypothetical protein
MMALPGPIANAGPYSCCWVTPGKATPLTEQIDLGVPSGSLFRMKECAV